MTIQNELTKIEQLVSAGNHADAEKLCERILKKRPGNTEVRHLSGASRLLRGDLAGAEKAFRSVLESSPGHVGALNNMGMVLFRRNEITASIEWFEKTLQISPKHFDALINLGNSLALCNRMADAAESYKKALELSPKNADLLALIGIALFDVDKEETIRHLQLALEIDPDNDIVLSNLITALYLSGDKLGAADTASRIAALPGSKHALYPAFDIAKKLALWDIIESTQSRLVQSILSGEASIDDIKASCMNFFAVENLDDATVFDIHRVLGKKIEDACPPRQFSHRKTLENTGKIRIGYMSADLYNHVVSNYLRGLINFYDRSRFEVYCYSNTRTEDDFTEQYKKSVDCFVDIRPMSDLEAAKRINDDGIHILVDLGGYTSRSRVAVLAYRPAPVQITYLGYAHSTGMTSIDYMVCDPYLHNEHFSKYAVEKPLILPHSFCCLGDYLDNAVDPAIPSDRKGHITFGTLNNLWKINPATIRIWSEILKAVPGSTLILNHPNLKPDKTRANIVAEFASHGIPDNRVEFIWQRHPKGSHMYYYNDIDIALDTFPMTGGTTSNETLWMGVPIITWVGTRLAHRITYSFFKNLPLELDDLIAFSEAEYISKAVGLAQNPERIRELHREIPDAIKKTVLTDPILFARHMEAAYIHAWNEKWPEHRVPEMKAENHVAYAQIRDMEIAVPASLEDYAGYLLREQGRWHDPEFDFILDMVKPGDHVTDIGAGLGMYAAPLAKKTNRKLIALATSGKPAIYLKLTKAHNALSNLEIVQKLGPDEPGLAETDFVRIGPETNDGKGGGAEGMESFFTSASPLVMFSIWYQSKIDLSTGHTLSDLGYELYRFIPGLFCLAPFSGEQDLDTATANLFAARPDRAEKLEKEGRLFRRSRQITSFPAIDDMGWHRRLESMPYFAPLERLIANLPEPEWSDVYRVALNLHAKSKDDSAALAERAAHLDAALNVLGTLLKDAPSFARLMSYARMLLDAGKRQAATCILDQLATEIDSGNIRIDEPFLALSEHYESVGPVDRIDEWIIVSIRAMKEKLGGFSSYFSGRESIKILEPLQPTGLLDAEMENWIAMTRERFHL